MTDAKGATVDLSGFSMEQLESIMLAAAQKYAGKDDVAGTFIEGLKLSKARAEAEAVRAAIKGAVSKALASVVVALASALPPGKELRVVHVPAQVDKDGKEIEPAKLSFDVDMGGGMRQMGAARAPRSANGNGNGRKVWALLDGKRFEGKTFNEVFLAVAPVVGAKVPTSSYSANRELVALAAKLKGRLTYGEDEAEPVKAEPVKPEAKGDKK